MLYALPDNNLVTSSFTRSSIRFSAAVSGDLNFNVASATTNSSPTVSIISSMSQFSTAQAFSTFQNALVYTVCAETVHTIVQDSASISLVVLIFIFALLIYLSSSGISILEQYKPDAKLANLFHLWELAGFLWNSMHNILVQFESTLVAKVAISVLPPNGENATWVFGLAVMSLTLLWLLKESTKRVATGEKDC